MTRRTSTSSSPSLAVRGPVDDGQALEQLSIKRCASRTATIAPAPTTPQQQQCSQQSFQPRSQRRHLDQQQEYPLQTHNNSHQFRQDPQRHLQRENDNGRADADSSGLQPDSVVQRGTNGAALSSSRALRPTQPLVTPLCQTIAPADEFDGHNVWDGSLFGKAAHPSSQPVARHSTKDNYGQAQCIGTTFDDEELYVGSQSEEDDAGVASAGLSRELEDHQGAYADDTDEGVRTKRGRRQRVSASHGSLNENEDGEDPNLSSLVDDPLGDDNLDDDNDLGDGEVRLHKRAKKGNGKEAFFAPGKNDLPDVSMITPASTASELSAHADLLGTCGDGRQWFNMSELRMETRRYLIFKTNWDTRDYSCLISRLGDGQADAPLAKVGGMRHGRTCGSTQHTKLLYDLLEAVAPFVREWLEHEEAGQAYLAGPSTRLENGKQVPRYPEMLAFKNIVRWSTVEAVDKKCLRDSYINNNVAKDPTRPFRKGLCKATMALMAFEAHRQL
ncbi:hypothetical protein MVLG_06187 [Microbotryum lychnidis-dioicae p1A1 Lamole]|uniref:Uncharacterized protein n=1 Tax=Microbotryum lychnidis-dioicae (strain p1A1 Lamole / MvSl-1064) TaxID=683840 RepID=U5HGH9_USTV1|nr:hypothetical protein MVLG_06187 [Microbotryum lychnidis-dioicae p1A1 Lamole]|eukprot:KDE03315.1 hypothetical protein MVLG_06187 [Microbotryum lychnidis-dioicae p1A1 Lamole]